MHQPITGSCGEQIALHPPVEAVPPLPCALSAAHDGRHEAKRADGVLLVWWHGHDATIRIS